MTQAAATVTRNASSPPLVRLDPLLLILVAAIVLLGLVMVASASMICCSR